jgi:hypothetical protein
LASPAIIEDIRTFKLQKYGLVTLAFLYCDFRGDQKKKKTDVGCSYRSLIDQDSDQGDLPLDAVLDKLPTHSTPAIVTLQVKDGPPAPSDVNTGVLTASPLSKYKQVARSQSSSSSSTFERQVLASAPTTNSQAVTPIAAASNWNPSLPPGSPAARPISTTDIGMAGFRTTGNALFVAQRSISLRLGVQIPSAVS